MQKTIFGLTTMAVLFAFVSSSLADVVMRFDPRTGKVVQVAGNEIIDDSPAGVRVRQLGGVDELVPSADIVRIRYEGANAGSNAAIQAAYTSEEKDKDQPDKILAIYQSKLDAVADSPVALRYFKYRIAFLTAAVADEGKKPAAIKLLADCIKQNPKCWQYPVAVLQLAALYADQEKPDYASAVSLLNNFSMDGTMPAGAREDAEMMLLDLLFQSRDAKELKARVDKLLKNPAVAAGMKARLEVYQIALPALEGEKREVVIPKLEAKIATVFNDAAKALAYNIMGDLYRDTTHDDNVDRKRDAMWCYLWVDIVYNKDHAEHLRALNRLVKLYGDEKDEEKKKFYQAKKSFSR